MKSTRIIASLIAACALTAAVPVPSASGQETKAAEEAKAPLTVGDRAPAIAVESFLKGEPVKEFASGHIYVMEFWATWCGPCIRGMPHLTEVQTKFKDKATIIGVNVWEEREYKPETVDKVKKFVADNTEKMGYTVAYDGSAKAMDLGYMKAAQRNGIPCAFIIDGEGRIAFIGHPANEAFEGTIQQLVDGKFDMAAAKKSYETSQAEERAARAKREASGKLMREAQEHFDGGRVDEGLASLDAAVAADPGSRVQIELRKIRLLLDAGRTDPASSVAKKLMDTDAKDNWNMLASISRTLSTGGKGDLNLSLQAAERAVELTKGENPSALACLAGCRWARGEKQAAIDTQQKAIDLPATEGQMKEALQKTLDKWKAEQK